MNIYIYSDESGVFDQKHNDYFVFGGVILFGTEEKENTIRKYTNVERIIRSSYRNDEGLELKASNISNADKGRIFRSLNGVYKFVVVIKEKKLRSEIFENKKHKQRYMDYAYKLVLKKCFESLIGNQCLDPGSVESIVVKADEHTTATDGRYELRENLLNEFKYGTFNYRWNKYYPPIFPCLKDVSLEYCDSSKTKMVRAADIVANHFFHLVIDENGTLKERSKTFILSLPEGRVISQGLDYFDN